MGMNCHRTLLITGLPPQLVYTFYCLVRARETRDVILGSADHLSIIELMIDMLQDKHEAIRRIAGNLLDVVRTIATLISVPGAFLCLSFLGGLLGSDHGCQRGVGTADKAAQV